MSAEQTGPFGGLTAEEAGRKSAEKQRLRRELLESDPQEAIIAKATEKALAGDVRAMKLLLARPLLDCTGAHDASPRAAFVPPARPALQWQG